MQCTQLYELHCFSSFTLHRIPQESTWMIWALIMLHWLLFCCLKVNGKAFLAAGEGEACKSLGRPDLHFGKCTWFSGDLPISLSVNTDSELSLLWETLRSFTHRLHCSCLKFHGTACVLLRSYVFIQGWWHLNQKDILTQFNQNAQIIPNVSAAKRTCLLLELNKEVNFKADSSTMGWLRFFLVNTLFIGPQQICALFQRQTSSSQEKSPPTWSVL